jgi:hypothetical protein
LISAEEDDQHKELINSDEIQKSSIILRGLEKHKPIEDTTQFLNKFIEKFKRFYANRRFKMEENNKDINVEPIHNTKIGEVVVYLPANFNKIQSYMDLVKDCDKKIKLLKS